MEAHGLTLEEMEKEDLIALVQQLTEELAVAQEEIENLGGMYWSPAFNINEV